MHIKHFTVILKVSERCNIDCDYCYYFNIGDNSWKDNPPYMAVDSMEVICRRFAEFASATKIDRLTFVFHGGEPMMAKIHDLEKFINLARQELGALTTLSFAIQTNGTVFNSDWAEFFERSQLAIGVSIDGPPEYHDIHRRTKQNKPTHELVSKFIKDCVALNEQQKISTVGTITVINNRYSIKKIVAHLKSEFNLSMMSFIMPDDAANDILLDAKKADEYGRTLIDLYNENVLDRRIRSKEILKFMSKLQHQEEDSVPNAETIAYIGVTVQSNAVMKVNEELIATGDWRKNFPVLDLNIGDIKTYIESPKFQEFVGANNRIPAKCEDCSWKNVCRGGSLQERKKPENGFNERSVFCKSYQQLYEYMYADLIHHGYPEQKLRERLSLN